MHKIFLAVSSMIVTGFLMKSYRKLREKPDTEVHSEIERRRADARTTFARIDVFSTPRDDGLMSSIDVLQQMATERFA